MPMPRQMQADRRRMRTESQGIPGAGATRPPPSPTVPGAARRRVAPATIDMAMGMLGPPKQTPTPVGFPQEVAAPNPGGRQQQPLRIQGDPSFSMSGEGRGTDTAQLDSGFGFPSLSGSPAMGTDLRDLPGFSVPSAPAAPSAWEDPLDQAISYTGGNPSTPDPGPTSIDDLANESSGGLYELLLETLRNGGRDVAGEQEAMAAAMERAQRQSMVDARAGFGAMGGGASGALAGIEGDIASQGALDQALAMADIEERARQEQLQKIGGLTSAYKGLEGVSADQKELEVLLGLLSEDDGAGTAPGEGERRQDPVNDVATEMANFGVDFTGEGQGFSVDDPMPAYIPESNAGWTRVGPSSRPNVSIWRNASGVEFYVMDGGDNYSGDGNGADLSDPSFWNPFD